MLTFNRNISTVLVFISAIAVVSPAFAQTDAETPATAPAADQAASAPVEQATSAPVTAPESAPAILPGKQDLASMWEDFIHYIRIARTDLAESYGKSILASNPDPKALYQLSAPQDVQKTLAVGAERSETLKAIVLGIQKISDEGYLQLRSDPKEIASAIELLSGSTRSLDRGTRLLQTSGEYALPQIIQTLSDPKTSEDLRARISIVLPKLGAGIVRGLAQALNSKDAVIQGIVANALGKLEYAHAVPQLVAISREQGVSEQVRNAAASAAAKCYRGKDPMGQSTAYLYYELAVAYYDHHESVAPDSRGTTANVWFWKEGLGLSYVPVPREAFYDIYAMRYARLAIQSDPKFYPAVSLWIAANLRRQADLNGKTDPTYGADTPSAQYYALSSSPTFLQDVLARGLKDNDTAVAIGAIEVLAKTAGAKSLVQAIEGGAQPLVQALGYSDSRVKFPAALALADALPQETFQGAQSVTWVLNEALQQSAKSAAAVIIADINRRNAVKDALRAAGYEVIDDSDAVKAITAIRAAGGVNVIVAGDKPDVASVLRLVRSEELLAGTAMLALSDKASVRTLAKQDKRMVIAPADANAEDIAKALTEARKLSAGAAFTPEEAAAWTVKAAEAIRLLGITGNSVYDIPRCRPALVALLADQRANIRIAAAKALAVIRDTEAQKAVCELALNAEATDDVRVAAFEALSESIRRFGNQLTDDMSQKVLDVVVGKGDEPLRVAAAQALGSMNLTSEKISALFMETTKVNQ